MNGRHDNLSSYWERKTLPSTDNLAKNKDLFITGIRKVASVLHSLIPLFIIVLFSAALWTLHQSLKGYNYHQIMSTLGALPSHRLFLSFGLSILSYLILTGYDSLALYYIRHPIAYARTALASFISYAFSQNISLPLASGVPVRYRLYSGWGLSAAEIGKVVIFNILTFNLGFLTVTGVIFLFRPVEIPPSLHLPLFTSVRPLGMISLGLVAGYLVLGVLRKSPIKILGWEFALPAPSLSLVQITISSLDWIVSASVLYVLLPPAAALSFLTFFGIYILAQIAGMVSQVPGGLGVFEAIVLLLLSPWFPVSTIMGSLLAFRGIYYLCPLGVAAALLGAHEVTRKKAGYRSNCPHLWTLGSRTAASCVRLHRFYRWNDPPFFSGHTSSNDLALSGSAISSPCRLWKFPTFSPVWSAWG